MESFGASRRNRERVLASKYERVLTDAQESSRLLAEVSNLTRLAWQGKIGNEAIMSVLAGVAGPLMCGFTTWMLHTARSAGIGRLYFLSREGQVLYELAALVNEHLRLGFELKYLYVSRHALNLVLLTNPDDLELLCATTGTKNYSVHGLMRRLGLEPVEVASHLQDIGLPEASWNIALADDQRARLFNMLQAGEPRQALASAARRVRALAEGYLAAEGVFDDVRIGLVDTAGIGTQVRTLHLLRAEKVDAGTEGFLVVRDWRNQLVNVGFPPFHAFITDRQAGSGYEWIPGLVPMLEIIAQADHGTVLGYQQRGGIYEPVLQTDRFDRGLACDPAAIRAVLKSFVTEYVRRARTLDAKGDPRGSVVDAFHAFWNDPTPAEADAWGRFQYEFGPRNNVTLAELAPKLRLSDLLAVKAGRKRYREYWFNWRKGSERRSAWHVRALLECARFVTNPREKSRGMQKLPRAQPEISR
jgi:hypothetical protein